MNNWTVHRAELTAWLRTYDGPRFHAVLSDPPYGLAFMAKGWDRFTSPRDYQAWVLEWASLLIANALHPGALCMFFGGARTVHRLTCGLEDAGFEIRDTMMWVYGSGFPKSQNISKAVDRALGAEPVRTGERKKRPDGGERNSSYGGPNGHDGYARPWMGRPDEEQNPLWETTPATPDAANWDGYGTALKPAYEPVVICQAPRGKATFVELALEHGSGALNIDGCRVGAEVRDSFEYGGDAGLFGLGSSNSAGETTQGRWPANFALVHSEACGDICAPDCPVRELDRQSGELHIAGNKKPFRWGKKNGIYSSGPNEYLSTPGTVLYKDKGGASRFFYKAKASRGERDAGLDEFEEVACGSKRSSFEGFTNVSIEPTQFKTNPHPCVKPLDLTTYLAKLLLPPPLDEPRRILAPFAGSGSEAIGAWRAGWDVIEGVELDEGYAAIAEARLEHWASVGVQKEMF